MKLKFNETPEQVALVKQMGSRNPVEFNEAMEAFAAFVGPVIQEVIKQAGTSSAIYRDLAYDEDDSPSIPLDLYRDEAEGFISTWSQHVAGGLPTNQIEGIQEMKISTYRLDSALSWMKKYARKARLDVIAKGMERMAQEVLLKQERNAWAVILRALAEARTTGSGGVVAGFHINDANTESVLRLEDFSRLLTLGRRINASWAGGTPDGVSSRGITDLYVSPEIMEQIRAFTYNPMSSRGGGKSDGTEGTPTDGIALPDSVREEIFRSAGASSVYGITLNELNELGLSRRYNTLFDQFDSGSIAFGAGFDSTTDEIVVGIDASKDAFLRPVARQAESGGTFVTFPDDQWVTRSDKAGVYGFLEEGRVCIDARAVVGLVV